MDTTKAAEDAIRQAEEYLDKAERYLGEQEKREDDPSAASESEIIMIADRSGSMEAIANDMEGGIRRLLREQLRSGTRVFLTACLFDDQYEMQCVSEPLSESRIDSIDIVPRGATALFDAMGRTLCQAVHSVPRQRYVIVMVITDGLENASCEFDGAAVNRLVAQCKERLGWQFVFLGASEQQVRQASDVSIGRNHAVAYRMIGPSVRRAMSITSNKLCRCLSERTASGLKYTEEERQAINAAGEE